MTTKANSTKICSKCELEQSLDKFKTQLKKSKYINWCILCRNEYKRLHKNEYYASYHQKTKNTKKAWAKRLYNYALERANERNIEFDLTPDWIINNLPVFCPVFGIKLDISSDDRNKRPSLDRVNNTQGYTQNNVRIISWRANRIKTDATLEELRLVVSYVEKHS